MKLGMIWTNGLIYELRPDLVLEQSVCYSIRAHHYNRQPTSLRQPDPSATLLLPLRL